MIHFVPGSKVSTFTTRNGQEAVIRYPLWEDVEAMTNFINELSHEDTYITFSGETITKEGEMYYLTEMFKSMEAQNSIFLSCFIGSNLVGTCTVVRDLRSRKRSYHVGIFGITIAQQFRGEGIGEELAKVALTESVKKIPGLKIFVLNVYSPNTIAQQLYKKLGFIECGRIPKSVWFKGEYLDTIKMYKEIADGK